MAPRCYSLDLPLPPSVNRSKRSQTTGRPLGNKSPDIQTWRKEAGFDLWRQRPLPAIEGDFEVSIFWSMSQFHDFDWDNRIKPLMDYLENCGIISNDKNCIGGSIFFDEDIEEDRCKVELWELGKCHSRKSSSLRSSRSTSGRRPRTSSSVVIGVAAATGRLRRG